MIITQGGFFFDNLQHTQDLITNQGGLLPTLFLAFSASLLGVSGFESSANFVEEQARGVFKKTLTNMLSGVAFFNPLIALVVLNVLPLSEIALAKDFLLAEAALPVGGLWLLGWIGINAFLVLCGAVLTSYVGVSGLVNRMSLDDCLPSFLIKENNRGSHPRIIWSFFLLCTSILLVTQGDLLSLAGVYTISFLCVMTLFALGNLILRQTRTELKRPYVAPFWFVIIAMLATAAGIIGNAMIDYRNVIFFLIYFVPALLVVMVNIFKKEVLASLLPLVSPIKPLSAWVKRFYDEAADTHFHVFIHHTERLHQILEYISRNENGWNITLIHCKNGDKGHKDEIKRLLPSLKKAGVYPFFNISFVYLPEEFGPRCIEKYARENNVPRNQIFIGSIHDHHKFDYEDLGGVRIIS